MVMKLIDLSNGGQVIVDDDDYELLSKWKWVQSNKGYAQRAAYKKDGYTTILMHRQIMDITDRRRIDHINGNPLDNQRINLRVCTQRQNMQNRKPNRNKASLPGIKGVYPHGNKWKVLIMINGKNKYIGLYSTIKEASEAYNTAAKVKDSQFAWQNC